LPRMKHLNRTKIQKPEWTPRMKSMMTDRYARDLEVFGYAGL
jgi:hypothetical protein